MNKAIVDFWILSLLIYIIFLLTHDLIWMVLFSVSMIVTVIDTVLEMVDEVAAWRKNRQRRQHIKDDIV